RLYFEPITVEDVMNIYENEKPEGVIVQFGGQTPLNIAEKIAELGVKILGTSPESINAAEDRKVFNKIINDLGIPQPPGETAHSMEQAKKVADKIGYPVMVRPSFVLGGRGMAIVYDEKMLLEYVQAAEEVSREHPMLIDKFLNDALEVEVDAICDGTDVYVAAVMEHIELAGIHSGDSACVIPSRNISPKNLKIIHEFSEKLAKALNVIGLINIQYAICDDTVYILEANPRASRTVPYVSKVIGIPIAKVATKVMMGQKLKDLIDLKPKKPKYYAVKEAKFSFNKFPDVDPVLGPEMKSTGEVMGISDSFGMAYLKAMEATEMKLPTKGTVLLSISDGDKRKVLPIVRKLSELGYLLKATKGTKDYLQSHGVKAELAFKINEQRPNLIDDIISNKIQFIINTPSGTFRKGDSSHIRKLAIKQNIPYITTVAAAKAAVEGLEETLTTEYTVKSIQEYHQTI
ncbi:MAG: carbamoyl-phosphate synthase large subunit, partial [Candidatus Altiarchaeota archaeon]|nr:carbamoyl-phosphate synthase large subunit [Candidatus Altiarchaeota archaeon]